MITIDNGGILSMGYRGEFIVAEVKLVDFLGSMPWGVKPVVEVTHKKEMFLCRSENDIMSLSGVPIREENYMDGVAKLLSGDGEHFQNYVGFANGLKAGVSTFNYFLQTMLPNRSKQYYFSDKSEDEIERQENNSTLYTIDRDGNLVVLSESKRIPVVAKWVYGFTEAGAPLVRSASVMMDAWVIGEDEFILKAPNVYKHPDERLSYFLSSQGDVNEIYDSSCMIEDPRYLSEVASNLDNYLVKEREAYQRVIEQNDPQKVSDFFIWLRGRTIAYYLDEEKNKTYEKRR